ncbi:hypothetical protein DL95DRAFT_468235 [Leptodontidium sp. 2 PMI_412]|nr:hypothetical protein DL95DRAFT_468235 [Leptodontidium sp. 2 PMI_412]
MGEIKDIPVVIVGGGSCGLNLSTFLSNFGVEHVLFERHAGTSILPKAHGINQRTMEIFRQYGLVDAIIAQGTPPRQACRVAWMTSLAGDGLLDRKVIGEIDCWGCKFGTERYTTYQRDAPHMIANLPLLRSEPIFRAFAEKANEGRVLFNHTVTDFEDEGEHVIVHVRDDDCDGKESTYRAKYLFGADGGKTVGPKLGIEMIGTKQLRQVVSFHFKADLSEYWDDRTTITHFANPEGGALFRSGSMLALGPTWGRFSEEWQIHFNLDLEVLHVNTWVLDAIYVAEYQRGRIFIGGDSAHRHPPTTGLGLNTAVQDAQNFAWKVAAVLQGKASPDLMSTYDAERRPIVKRNAEWALFTWRRHGILGAAKVEANRKHFTNLFDENSETGRAGLASIQHVIDGQVLEFGAHDMDLGFYYPEGSLVPDAKVKGVGLKVAVIVKPGSGAKKGEYVDTDYQWHKTKDYQEGGAILIRPDNIVGWRALNPGNGEELSEAFDCILSFKAMTIRA